LVFERNGQHETIVRQMRVIPCKGGGNLSPAKAGFWSADAG